MENYDKTYLVSNTAAALVYGGTTKVGSKAPYPPYDIR